MRATATAIVCVRAPVCVCCVRVCQGFHCKHNMMYTMPTSLSLSLLLSPLSRALPTSLQSSLKSCIYANYIIFYYNFLTRTPQKVQQLAKLCQLSNFRFELALPFTLSPSLFEERGLQKAPGCWQLSSLVLHCFGIRSLISCSIRVASDCVQATVVLPLCVLDSVAVCQQMRTDSIVVRLCH